MKIQWLGALCFGAALLVPAARAQSSGWQRVMNLRPGTEISILRGHRFRCTFVEATDEELVCERGTFLPLGPIFRKEFTFRRDDLREVRLEHPDASTLAGAAIGATAGGVVGANRAPNGMTRSGGAFVGAALFGVVGGVVGHTTSFLHGAVIYRR
jgi:hypothetical protein